MNNPEVFEVQNQVRAARASLYAKLARVMGAMTRLQKTGYNKFHGYKFASEADVADLVREAMAENNLALLPQIVKWERVDTGRKTSGGSITFNTILEVEFTFCDGDTGATESRIWYGEANDSDDKGFNKAVTAAEKYFLLKTFMISSGDKADDPDHSEDDKPAKKKPAQPASNVTPINTQKVAQTLGSGSKPRRIETVEEIVDGTTAKKPAPQTEDGEDVEVLSWDTGKWPENFISAVRGSIGNKTLMLPEMANLVGIEANAGVKQVWVDKFGENMNVAVQAVTDAKQATLAF